MNKVCGVRSQRGMILLGLLSLLFVFIPFTYAQEPLQLTKEIIGNPTSIDTGDILEYRLVYSCNSLVTDCATLTVTDILPANVTWLETQVAAGFTPSFNAGTNTVTIVSDGPFLDGSQSEALIRVRVNYDVPGGTIISNSATGDRSNSPANPDVTTPPINVTVNDPVFDWEVRKTQVAPSIGPALDNDVTYRLQVCSNTAIGNVSLTNVSLFDTLPPNVIIVNDGGGTVSGVPATGQTITWTLGDLDIAVVGNGCVSRTIVIQYPSAFYSVGDIPDNVATATGNHNDPNLSCTVTLCPIGTETLPTEIEIPQPDPGGNKTNSGTIVGIGGLGRFFVNVNTTAANVPVNNLVVVDTIDPQLEITQINAANWSIPATLEYSTDGGGTYLPLGVFQDGVNLSSPGDFPTNVTNLRWSFTGAVPYGFSGQAEVVFIPRNSGGANDAVSGNSYQNCFAISADAPAGPVNGCSSVTIDDDNVVIAPSKTVVGANTMRPNDIVTFNLRLRIDERSSQGLLNPVMTEALPNSLEFITDVLDPDYAAPIISFTNVSGAEQIQPTLTIQNNVTIDGVNYNSVLVWTWPPGYQLSAPPSGVRDINIEFRARVRPGTPPALYENRGYITTDAPDLICSTGTSQTDGEDLDGDGNITEDRCRVGINYEVEETVVLSSEKWISSPAYQLDSTFTGFLNTVSFNPPEPDPTCPSSNFNVTGYGPLEFTRYPCVTQGFPDNTHFAPPDPDQFDDFFYWLVVENEGNVAGSEYILYDILPYVGDTGSGGPLSGSARESEFAPYIIGPVNIESLPAGLNASDLTIEYSNSTNPCRTEVFNDIGGPEPSGCTNDWTTTAPTSATPNTVRAFRIRFNNPAARFPILSQMQFSVPMRIPEDAQSGQIAWNSFAQRVSNPGTGRIPTSEARKVGITVPQRMSVGNFVWLDYNNDGTPFDDSGALEAPVVGATVSLYRDANNDGVPDSAVPVATDITDANGFYLFGDIVYDGIDLTQNRYVIGIDASNFNIGNPLYAHLSSTGTNGDNQTDLDDNGIDDPNPVASTYGILGPSFELSIGDEPINETQLSGDNPATFPTGHYPDGPFSRGVRAEPDDNSDLTIDFGFYVPMSVGNRVWFDTGAGALTNNGLEDPSESANGIAGVTLTIYRDNGNGTFGTGDTVFGNTTTDVNGYYLFDNLPPGNYFVAVDQTNFSPGGILRSYEDSDNVPNTDVDQENKGDNNVFLGSSGVVSTLIVLEPFTEPIAGAGPNDEVDQTTPVGFTSPHGNTGELDSNSNLTIDFGFWSPGMALGNFVWEDVNNNNVYDIGEIGLDDITINLYEDMDENGVPDGPIFMTTVTSLGGWYIFDNLAPGAYIIEIPASEFDPLVPDTSPGRNLEGYISSNRNYTIDTLVPPLTVPTGNFDTDWDDQKDDGLNQTSAAGYRANGIRSETVTLIPVSEPHNTGGSEPDGGLGIGAGGKDENSDLTVDFGVFEPLSIGNRVWIDDYSSGDGVTVKGDGIFDMVNESPVDGVTLTIFKLNDGGNPANLADYSIVQFSGVNQTDTTADGGYYLFDGLGEGTYRIRVDATNFQAGNPLEGHRSSDNVNGADSTDSGIDNNNPAVNAIFSDPIVLTRGNQPTLETDANDSGQAVVRDDGIDGFGVYEEDDDNSDLTVDFGFYTPPMSLGNRVWYDTNNNGIIDAADDNPATPGNPGIAGVTVNLYLASNTAAPIATTVTDTNGYYLFDDLAPGDYVVGIPTSNFAGGQALESLTSSTGNFTDNVDSNDNGIDDISVPLPNEIFSNPINLALDSEVTGETDLSNNPADVGPGFRGTNGEKDNNSDLTIDFGFFEPLSVGNRVWLDNGAGSPGFTGFNNALQDGTEPGIAGVRVNLYLDEGNGIFDGTEPQVATKLTDANGYYLFDGLISGGYFVQVDATNFATVLNGLQSSFGNTNDEITDRDDNGIDDPAAATNGIISHFIQLNVDSEATGETDLSGNIANDGPLSRGRFGEDDDNSNLTIDFGFASPPMSLGNRLWFDDNNDGLISVGETFVNNAAVSLYIDADQNGVPDGPAVLTTTTDINGYYLFDNLPAGDYVIGVDAANFAAAAVLENYASSTVNNANGVAGDSDDNGLDTPTPATNGIFSATINLSPTTEPTGETDLGPGHPGTHGETDNNSDLTIDFGFFIPMSVGNRVWLDNGAGSPGFTGFNNGVQDGTEAGIPNVTVSLYRDNGDGNFNSASDTLVSFETTNADGYYLFDGLPQGNYFVHIPALNFLAGQALDGFSSSFPLNVNGVDGDLDDEGIDNPDPATNGITSALINLTQFTEPTGEADLSGDPVDGAFSRGNNGELNENSNLTIDFGFNSPPMSLGNRVWLDDNNSGTIDAADGLTPGIANVAVSLYLDADQDNNPDGPAILTDITDAEGYYLFDNLPAGNYIIGIDASNFQPAGVLQDYGSSTLENVNGAIADNDDEGIDNNNPAVNGIYSLSINLAPGTEPTGEADLSNNAADGPAGERRGNNGETDANSDLTQDFGFFRAMSIGNRVWADNGNGGGIASNGIQDGGELGIPNVTLTLFRDNGDGIFDRLVDTIVGTDTTDANGYYLFDGLTPATYFVWVDNTNFVGVAPLANFDSSPGNGLDNGIDLDDNGIDENFPATNGVVSVPVVLVRDNEPTTETDFSNNASDGPNFIGNNNEINSNSDISIDFGFSTEPFSIGNRVWFDPNNNGLMDPTELGIAGVTVNLYRDNNNNGLIDVGEFLRSDLTDSEGYYLFDGLTAGSYILELSELDFRLGGVLVDLFSSNGNAPDNQTDLDDNGIDNINPEIGGIISPPISLTKNAEPIGETDLSNNPADGPAGQRRGNNGELDSNSDLTIDFGLYKPMSLGNRVWFDTNNSATMDGVESGIGGVVVNLYLDANNNGIIDVGELVGTDATDSGGYYLFDNLTPGDYIVEIPASNFNGAQPLVGLNSSTGNFTDNVDRNDNGIDDAAPATNGILSNVITLSLNGQPTGETDVSSNPAHGINRIGTNGETDNNSDITVDFGFVGALMSIGNRVWLDPNNNGILDVTEAGIPNVTVRLYRDTNNDGIPNGAVLLTTTTDANGYYIFDGLTPGDYIVTIPNSNFSGGNPLNGLLSSTGNGTDNQQDSDVDENGIDTPNGIYGIMSTTITLTANSETTAEVDLGPAGNGSNGETANNSDLTIDFAFYEPMSIGNRVWFDTNNNGLRDGTESGIGLVTVNLYRDDGTGTFVQVATTTTDGSGYYLFDGLATGNYYVEIPEANFQAGGALINLLSSTGANATNVDNNDNGIDNPTPATGGVISNVTTLVRRGEPTNETDLGPNGHGTHNERNDNSDLTIDFGFHGGTMALGNRVWIDNGAGGGTARDGIRDAGEPLVANARLSLFVDANADGNPDGAAIRTTTTDANGYYIFDNLAPGNYLVRLDASNFAPAGVLAGYTSTLTNVSGIPDTDNDDNGIDNTNPALNGIISNTINLQLSSEPTTETDLGPQGHGTNGETNDNSNLTVDFGVYRALSIGNRVWFDPNNNGLIDPTEIGVGGVRVSLYRDDNLNGIADVGELQGTDTTDGNGYYLFDNLIPADYIVIVDNTNFQPGGALAGFASSTGHSTSTTIDRDDNGIDDPDPLTNGIPSVVITLTENGAPTGETDLSGDVSDGPNFRGRYGESDNNSNLTIDFGFVAGSMSLGNRIWLDDGAGGGTANDGIHDSGEAGVGNVLVNLFADVDGNGIPDGVALATDTTDANGYYLFDGLAPGNYLVQVAPSNFQTGGALFGLFSSTGNNTNTDDRNDNGIDNSSPEVNGILSNSIALVADNAPLGETDLGPEGNGSNGENDQNANLTVDFGFSVAYDLGDAPDSYGTTLASNGPRHVIISTLHLGRLIDSEADGQPGPGADGDDTNGLDDEDGLTLPTLVAGTTVSLDVTVLNNTGTNANVVLWIDFNANGVFDPAEGFTTTVPSNPSEQVVSVNVVIPIGADVTTGGSTYARVRLSTDPGLTTATPTGPSPDGEIEDYVVSINPPGLSITKTDHQNSLAVGQLTTYTITINNSGAGVVNRNFQDNIPTAAPDGFDPSSITWSCTATGGASCISGQAAGTGDTGTGPINTNIDIPRDGQIIFSLIARLNAAYSQPTVSNTAELESGERATDLNNVISNPPVGTKAGTVVSDNLIRWTITWINTGTGQTSTIIDPLKPDQTFAGNLDCSVFGTTTQTSCIYDPVTNAVRWQGMHQTGEPNRVVISLDVTVAGNGEYINTSSIDVGGRTNTVESKVRIGPETGSTPIATPPAPDGAPVLADPIIVKLVNPQFIQPGETATWTITVTNPTALTLTNIQVSDDVIVPLRIISATTTNGTITVVGQVVRTVIPSLAPGEVVTITMITQLDPNYDQSVVSNVAYLDSPYVGDSTANLIIIDALPATGESPLRTYFLLALVSLSGLGILTLSIFYFRKSKQS